MNKNGQNGAILVLVLLAIVAIGLYFTPYGRNLIGSVFSGFTAPSVPSNTTSLAPSVDPLTVSASLQSTSQLYSGQKFSVLLDLKSQSQSTLSLSINSFGCSFTQSSKSLTLPPYDIATENWTFSSSSPASCTLQFRVCFPYSSGLYFPFSFENYQYTGSVPTAAPIRSVSPLSISTNMPSVIVSPPSQTNNTYYLTINQVSSQGSAENEILSSVYVNTNLAFIDPIYIVSSSGASSAQAVYSGSPGYLSSPQELALSTTGSLEIPFVLTTMPANEITDYSQQYYINVTADYTYCIDSNYIPISIQ